MPSPRPPCYELFFAPLEIALDPTTLERVQFAYFASKYGHSMQVRDDDTRYFDHPKSAAWIYIDEFGGLDPQVIIDILIHDLGEDSYLLSPYRIMMNFGEETALDIRALTKLPKGKETTANYLERIIRRGPKVIMAKLCDRLHNLRSLHSTSESKRDKTIAETKEYHIPLLIGNLRTFGQEWEKTADLMEHKILIAINQY